MSSRLAPWEALLLALPVISFFDEGFVFNHTPFLLVVVLVVAFFYGYPMSPI